jgi:hypothetical protein
MDQRYERVRIETDRHLVTGRLTLPREGYRSRLTDYLNSAERAFLALTDVEIAPLDGGGPPESRPFLALSLRHVVMVVPEDTEEPSDSR